MIDRYFTIKSIMVAKAVREIALPLKNLHAPGRRSNKPIIMLLPVSTSDGWKYIPVVR